MTRIRSCAKLESETDTKMKQVKETQMKIMDTDTLCATLKGNVIISELFNHSRYLQLFFQIVDKWMR